MNEITTPTPAHRSVLGRLAGLATRLAVGAVAGGALVLAGSGVSGAIAIEPADAYAEVAGGCSAAVGPQVTLSFTNPSGSSAHFEVEVDWEAIDDVTVPAGQHTEVVVPVKRGAFVPVSIGGDNGYVLKTTVLPLTCWDTDDTIALACTDDGPVVNVLSKNVGELEETVTVRRDSTDIAVASLAPGEVITWSIPVAEDAEWLVGVWTAHSGSYSVSDHADCVEPDPSDEVTDEPVDEPATTTTSSTTPPAQVESATLAATPVAVSPSFTG